MNLVNNMQNTTGIVYFFKANSLFQEKISSYDSETQPGLLHVAQHRRYKVCFTSWGEFVVYTLSTPTSPERVEN